MKQSNVFEFAEYNATSGPPVILHVLLLGVAAAAPRRDLHGELVTGDSAIQCVCASVHGIWTLKSLG